MLNFKIVVSPPTHWNHILCNVGTKINVVSSIWPNLCSTWSQEGKIYNHKLCLFRFMVMSWLTLDLPKGTVHPKLKNTNCPPTFGAVFTEFWRRDLWLLLSKGELDGIWLLCHINMFEGLDSKVSFHTSWPGGSRWPTDLVLSSFMSELFSLYLPTPNYLLREERLANWAC